MTKTTARIMKQLRRKLTKLSDLENGHCGYPDLVSNTLDYRFDTEEWLVGEIEALAKKAGCE